MIAPTIGRVVWYTPTLADSIATTGHPPFAALVAQVHTDSCVNLGVVDGYGNMHSRTSVLLVPDDAQKPDDGSAYCEWMPYQKGQAAKVDAMLAKTAQSS